ncbi:DUF397 domain-containing protein [Streptomyces seoulensis]|uniref:DUF397 domain-containing protein n=1 Tax=Streptomyces seoulensis TaxID=73044 RepID=UPI001FCBC8D3|nr:DUF397 domain-containing protein [Streptomyces seoulensis]BDH04923.1 hypothetical protein HEK131_21500 [Streptomyces seoulensis]
MQQPNVAELSFKKSSASVTNACVEVALLPNGGRALRDSKHPNGPVHLFDEAEWSAFLAGAKAGEFDN